MSYGYFMFAPRKSVAARRADAERRIRDAAKRGKPLSPVALDGRTIARTYWGKAWCDNLERYRDFAYRLERGRSYVRSGSVIDLRIGAGKVDATVCGSSLYEVAVAVDAVPPTAWRAIRRDCAGSIGSRVDLLAGKLSDAVMARLCADGTGLFPAPTSIRFTCTCPDYAIMCKHVAATMYGVGARLDRAPELLFTLRRVSLDDLVASALADLPVARPSSSRVLAADGLAALFGLELADSPAPTADAPPGAPRSRPAPRAKPRAKTSPAPAARPAKRVRAARPTKPSVSGRPSKRPKPARSARAPRKSQRRSR
jgi:uncharacterized Zn finger protein